MIYDKLSQANLYYPLSPRIEKALRYLQETDFSIVRDGRHEIDGDNLFALVSTYQTKSPVGALPEGHTKYIDLQYLLSGEEDVLCGFIEDMSGVVESRLSDDLEFYKGDVRPYTIGNGKFLLLFPGDIHAPGVWHQSSAPVRKALVKIKI
jgi:biofilm protein TabA